MQIGGISFVTLARLLGVQKAGPQPEPVAVAAGAGAPSKAKAKTSKQ